MKKELLKSKTFLIGAGLLAVGSAPLLLYILYEAVSGSRGGNPVGLGLLFFVSFWPAVILMAVGAVGAFLRTRGAPR